ncbi:MAG TPA: amidohydrolase family protein [Solirubrobacter sp.]|nr:amidohydrolase family protein [Solirubrobacter sp.]
MIDAYAHIIPPRCFARLETLLETWQPSERVRLYRSWLREDEVLGDLEARWRLLEQFPDYRQVLVFGVYPMEELGDPATATALSRDVNDELAGLVADHPDRFAGFAAELALNDVDAAVGELERAATELGALGAQIHTNVHGVPLDDPRFEPLFAKAHELDRALWLHPGRSVTTPDFPAEPESRFGIWWSLGWPYETAVAMARLVYAGYMERYPGLKIITHHGGGMIPHFSGRLDAIQTEDQREVFEQVFQRPALDYFRMFYADTGSSARRTGCARRSSSSGPTTCCSAPTCRSAVRRSSRTPWPTCARSACPRKTSTRSSRATPSGCSRVSSAAVRRTGPRRRRPRRRPRA